MLAGRQVICPCFSSAGSSSSSSILSMDAVSVSRAIQRKDISCYDLMEATLNRINDINGKLNAIILMKERDELLSLAQKADDETTTTNTSPNSLGFLHGIPIAIKDLCNAEGIPTSMGGSPLFSDFVPNISDVYVENIQKSGAIIIGKTNTPECGMGSHTFNERWGATSNPFDNTKSAGGSSGGAAVAVSTNMLCLADGTDMMGSLRNPAGWNNIYSHRPTAGMIPTERPHSPPQSSLLLKSNPLSHPISTAGPMAKTPLDCAYLLEAMVGNKDTFDAQKCIITEENTTPDNNNLRIGWLGDWDGNIPFEDGILSLCRSALVETFNKKGTGVIVDDVNLELFPSERLWQGWNTARFSMAFAKYTEQFPDLESLLLRDDSIKEEMRWEIAQGKLVSPNDLKQSAEIYQDYRSFLDRIFAQYDILALPSAQVWPFPKEWRWPKAIDGVSMDAYHRWMEVCVPVSFGGLPCSTVPAGFGRKNNLPMGIQLFAKRGEDTKLIQVALGYHDRNKQHLQSQNASP